MFVYISRNTKADHASSFGEPNCTFALYIIYYIHTHTHLYTAEERMQQFIILYLYYFFSSKSRFFDGQYCVITSRIVSSIYISHPATPSAAVLYIHNIIYDSFFTTAATSLSYGVLYDFHKSSVPRRHCSRTVLQMKREAITSRI